MRHRRRAVRRRQRETSPRRTRPRAARRGGAVRRAASVSSPGPAGHRLVQASSSGPWLDAHLFDQQRAGSAERLERLRLPTRDKSARMRRACRRSRSGCRATSSSRRPRTSSWRPASRSARSPVPDLQEQLVQTAHRRSRERLVGDVDQRRPAPQRERLPSVAIAARGNVGQSLEALDVDGVGRKPQLVPARARDDLGAPPSSSFLSWETWSWISFTALAGGRSPQDRLMSSSIDTSELARKPSIARTARCLVAPSLLAGRRASPRSALESDVCGGCGRSVDPMASAGPHQPVALPVIDRPLPRFDRGTGGCGHVQPGPRR